MTKRNDLLRRMTFLINVVFLPSVFYEKCLILFCRGCFWAFEFLIQSLWDIVGYHKKNIADKKKKKSINKSFSIFVDHLTLFCSIDQGRVIVRKTSCSPPRMLPGINKQQLHSSDLQPEDWLSSSMKAHVWALDPQLTTESPHVISVSKADLYNKSKLQLVMPSWRPRYCFYNDIKFYFYFID